MPLEKGSSKAGLDVETIDSGMAEFLDAIDPIDGGRTDTGIQIEPITADEPEDDFTSDAKLRSVGMVRRAKRS